MLDSLSSLGETQNIKGNPALQEQFREFNKIVNEISDNEISANENSEKESDDWDRLPGNLLDGNAPLSEQKSTCSLNLQSTPKLEASMPEPRVNEKNLANLGFQNQPTRDELKQGVKTNQPRPSETVEDSQPMVNQ